MKTLREFAIKTKLDKIGFLPGDVIHGDLYLYFEQPSEIQAVEIFFYGIGSGPWLEQFDMEVEQKLKLIDSAHPQPHNPKQKRKLVDIGLLLYGFAEPRNNKAIVHEQGRYVYEFEINIPDKIPCTFKSPSQKDLGYARYYLKAVMSRPKKRVKVTKIPIVINELLDPDRPDLAFLPGSFQEKNLRTACLPTGSLSLECHLSKSHYIQGERILIQALAQNCSPKVLKEMYAKLVRRVRCKSSFGTNTFTSNEASIHGTKIPAQTTIEWKKEELQVPAIGPTIAGNREIRIDYMVRIGMYEELGCEVHLDLPVVIGTVGLPDRKDGKETRKESESRSKSTRKDKPRPNQKLSEDNTTATTTTSSNNNDEEQKIQIILTSDAPDKSGQTQSAGTEVGFPKKKQSVEHYDAAIGIQNALNDIDQDVSRIKRRISQAKESVSRSFDLDFEFDKIATDRIASGEPQHFQLEQPVVQNEAWENAAVNVGFSNDEKTSDVEGKKSRKRSSTSSKCSQLSQDTVVEKNEAIEKRNYSEMAAKSLPKQDQQMMDQSAPHPFDALDEKEGFQTEGESTKIQEVYNDVSVDDNAFPIEWNHNKTTIEEELSKAYATVEICNQQVQSNESDNNSTCPVTYSDVYLSDGVDVSCKKSKNTYVSKEHKYQDSRIMFSEKKINGHKSEEESLKKDDQHSKKGEFQPPVVAAQTEFQEPQSWTNVFEKYGSKEITQSADSTPFKKEQEESIQIPTNDSTPCFEGFNEKKSFDTEKEKHPEESLPTEDFKTFAYYVERERKELDERVQRYLQDGGKSKASYKPSSRRRSEESRGYYDRMNKSMDAIRELSSTCSEETQAAQQNNNNNDYYKDVDGKPVSQTKRPPPQVRSQRRLSGRTNIHRRNSTESMSSDDQVLIDYRGLNMPFSDLHTSLDRRVLKYLKEKEDLTKEYTDATTASSTTPVSSTGSAPPPVSTTPVSSSSSMGRSSSSPFMDVKASKMESHSPRGLLPVTTEESEVESGREVAAVIDENVVLPQNISEETAKIFLELLDFASDDARGDEGNQYFEDVTYKFLKCLQVDAKGRKIEYKGGFLDTIRQANADIMAAETDRMEDLKTLVTSTVMNVNNKLETTFDHFDNNFENMRQRIIENFKCDASKQRVAASDINELEECLAAFDENFDYIREKHLASLRNEELEGKLGTGDFGEHFRKFKCDLHHLRNIFVSSLKDGTGCVPNNTIDAIKVIFFEFDTNLENGRRKLIEGLKKTLQRITAQLYKCTTSFDKQCRSRLSSSHSESQQSDTTDELTYLRGNIKDVNKVIIKYFLSEQPASSEVPSSRERGNNLIKEIQDMGYNVTLSDDNKLQVTESSPDIDVRRPSDGVIMDEEISRSISQAFSQEREAKLNEAKQLLDSDTTDHETVIELTVNPTTNEKKEMCIVMEVETAPTKDDEEEVKDSDNREEADKNQESESGKNQEFDEAFFPVFDEPENAQKLSGSGTPKDSSYVPVPYEPLMDDTAEAPSPLTQNKHSEYESKKSFQVHLKCKESDSEESQMGGKEKYQDGATSTTPFSSEESDFNQKSPAPPRGEEQLEQFDHVFEALRQNFLECLKSEQRAKSKRGSKQEDFEEDFQVFNKLDEDFEEIRQTFIESLRKDKNTAIDSIEESLCKFDDNFDEIRQKFLSSLKDEKESAQDTTFTDLEASIDRFDDDFEELRQKFMASLRTEKTEDTAEASPTQLSENGDDFEKLRQKFMESLKKENESTADAAANDLNRTYTKITPSKMNTTYTKVSEASKSQASQKTEDEQTEAEKMNESYVSPCLSKTMSTDSHQPKDKTAPKRPGPDHQSRDEVSWLDLNALGQFGPEEFSAGDSRCILPTSGEIVILQEPKGMPQFTKYSYSPQHIKKLKGAKPTKAKGDDGKAGQKAQSKIKTKIKSRGKFMSDVHIVTDEPKHVEPTGPANRSWLDLNAIGQLGPEEEISGDNQFLLPTGKEVIILGEGGKMSDTDHLAQLSNLRRKSSGKCDFRRRGSKEKDMEVQRKLSGTKVKDSSEHNNNRMNVTTPPPRTTSLRQSEQKTTASSDDGQWKRVVMSPERSHDDESRSIFTPYDLPEEEEIPPPRSDLPTFEEIISSIENAIGVRPEEKNEGKMPVENDGQNAPGDENHLPQQPLPPIPSRESSFYVDAREMSVEMDIEEIFMEEAHGKTLTQVNEDEFEVIPTPGDKGNDENQLPVINLVVETEESNKTDSFNIEMIKDRKKSPGFDQDSLREITESGHQRCPEPQDGSISPVKIIKDTSKDGEEDASDSFIHRATNYMKTFFRFSYSDNEKSDNEKLPKEDTTLQKNTVPQEDKKVNEKPHSKHPVDMDATDNFIEDLPSLVSDKTDTSDVGTTENSLRGPRKPGPEERYNHSDGEGLYNEIPMFVERLEIPKRKSLPSEKEISEFSEDLKSGKADGVDLDATENLIEDIYLVTDEPDSSEAKSLPTASSRASNKVDRHYSTDERQLLGKCLQEESENEVCDEKAQPDWPEVAPQESDWLKSKLQSDVTGSDQNLQKTENLEIEGEFLYEDSPERAEEAEAPKMPENNENNAKTSLADSGEEVTNHEKIARDPRYRGIPKSKHIGPEEVCSVEEKSLLALDKDIFVQADEVCDEVEEEKEDERICVKSSSDSGVNEETGNFVRDVEGELQVNETSSFKPGPEEWITSKDVVLSSDIETSENDVKTESIKENSIDSDKILKKPSTERYFKRLDSGGEVEMMSLKGRSDSSNGTYDIVSNRGDTLIRDSSEDIRHATKCLYGQLSPAISITSKDSNGRSPSKRALPELEPIPYDVTMDCKKQSEEERSASEKDSEMEHLTKGGHLDHMEGLEELKMLHLKTYSGTDSGTDQHEAGDGDHVSTFTPRKGGNETCTILNSADEDGSLSKLFASAQFTQAMKNQTQNKRPPTGKRKRKVRDRRLTGSPNEQKNAKAVEKALAEKPLDVEVSLVRNKKSDEDQDTDAHKTEDTKLVPAIKANIKRKEWKLDFGGNIRPSPLKEKKSQKGFENFMFGVPDASPRKGGKLTGKKDGLSPKMKKKLMTNYAGAVRERMHAKEKKNRALKVINLTVEKEQEFKKLTKAIKKKLILKNNEEKQLISVKSKIKKDSTIKRKSSHKKEDKSGLPPIAKKNSTTKESESIENQLAKDAEKKKRRNSSGKLSTSSSEDICAMSHASRLESESNKRNQPNSKEKPASKAKTSVGSEKGKKKKASSESMYSTDESQKPRSAHDDVLLRRTIELSVDHEDSAAYQTPPSRSSETDVKGRRKVRRSDKMHENRDGELDSLMSTMLTSSFRTRAANKLSSPESDNHTDSGDGKLDEIEYEIDWEILKRGVKGDHDSSSSYFTAEEVSKPSSSESSGSTPRELLLVEPPMISLKMVPDSSEAPEATSPEILSDCNTGKLFFAGNVPRNGGSRSQHREGYDGAEEGVDLTFSWDSGPRPSKPQHHQQPIILVERSSSDRDSGITSSGEETSKSQLSALENNLKQNFMERSIYKLQSISEEDKITDDDTILNQSREGKKAYPFSNNEHSSEKETLLMVGRVEAYSNHSGEGSANYLVPTNDLKTGINLAEDKQFDKDSETVEQMAEDIDKMSKSMENSIDQQDEISREELMLEETIAFLQRPQMPIEACMSSLDIKNLKEKSPKRQFKMEDGINFSGELITFDCDDEEFDEEEDLKLNSKLEEELSVLEEVGVYEDKKNISENLPLYLNKEKKEALKDEDAILKDRLNQFFADTCMKQDLDDQYLATSVSQQGSRPVIQSNSTSSIMKPSIPPLVLTNEEEIFRKEFERLREFERLEEAFQEGKTSGLSRESHLIPLKSEDEYVENSLSGDVITVATDVTGDPTSDAFYPRAPMTPITEESASSIEDIKSSESKKAKDDNCQLFKPSKVSSDIAVVTHKSPIKKKGGKSPKRKKQKKGGKKGESGDADNVPVAKMEGGKVNKRYNGAKTKGDKVKTNKAAKLRKSVQLVKSNSNTSTNSEAEHYYDRFKMRATKSLLSELKTLQTNQSQARSDDMESATDGTIINEHTDLDVELVVDDDLDVECTIDGLPNTLPTVTTPESDMFDQIHPEFEHNPTKERVESVIKQVDNCVFRNTSSGDERARKGVPQAAFDNNETGLEIIVTDISSNADDAEEARKRRRSSSSSSVKKQLLEEKEKEQEVNRKVMKVIKLFTEAINKKEIEEGASSPDNCFSQQIMNSIFNAAQQSAYFEEESTADIIKALEAEEACQDLEVGMELAEEERDMGLDSGVPHVGTAVQQYKQSMTGTSKARTSPLPRSGSDSKSKTKSGKAAGASKMPASPQPCSSEARQTRSGRTPTTYNVNYLRRKFEDDAGSDTGSNKPNVSSRFLGKKTEKGKNANNEVVKKANPRSVKATPLPQPQDNTSANEAQQTSMKNTSARKPARGEYVSPYRQQLKKHNKTQQQQQKRRQEQHKDEQPQFQQQLEQEQKKQQKLPLQVQGQQHQGREQQEQIMSQREEPIEYENEKEDEYQEIEVDVKIKVTPIEDDQLSTPEGDNTKRRKSSTESTRSKSAEPRRERSKSRNDSLTRIGRTDAKKLPSKIPKADDARSSSADRRKPHQNCFQENGMSRDTKITRDWSAERNERMRRSSSEVSPKANEQKKESVREKRRSSTESTRDKFKADGKSLKRNDSLEVDTRNSKNQEKEKKSPPYTNDVGGISRGPVFPYMGYIESKKADSPPRSKAKKPSDFAETDQSHQSKNTLNAENESQDPLKMISSSKASDTNSTPSVVRPGGKFDSSFAIIHSMSNEFNCEDMSEEGEKKHSPSSARSHTGAPTLSLQHDVLPELDESSPPKTGTNTEVKTDDNKRNRSWSKGGGVGGTGRKEEEGKRGRRCRSVSDEPNLRQRKHERKSRSLDSNGRSEGKVPSASPPITRDHGSAGSGGRKVTGNKIYHTLPASTGGANLFVESRGAILPYIGHIERLDVEMSKTETESKQTSPITSGTESSGSKKKSADEKGKTSSGTDSANGTDAECPSATVRSSTPNNVALEVKIPLPTELSSSLDQSDSQTLTFNIDVSLDSSELDGENNNKKSSTRKSKKKGRKNKPNSVKSIRRESETEQQNFIQEDTLEKKTTMSFDGTGGANSTNTVFADSLNGPFFDEEQKDIFDMPRRTSEQDIGAVRQDIIDKSPAEVDESPEDGGRELKDGREHMFMSEVNAHSPTGLDSAEISPKQSSPSSTKISERAIYPYNHFISPFSPDRCNNSTSMNVSANERRGSKEKNQRKSWPSSAHGKSFESTPKEPNSNYSSSHTIHSASEREDELISPASSCRKMSEERVCLGGGLVFNAPKKTSPSSRHQRRQTSPRTNRSTKQRKTDTRKITKSSSMPSRSVAGYTSRCNGMPGNDSNANRRIPAAYGLTTASMPSYYRTPASSLPAAATLRRSPKQRDSRMEGLNEEKVNNLVCDIKDAGATISDILDEMQALKMFLNEEDGAGTSANRSSSRLNDNIMGPESSLLMASSDTLFPWQRSSSVTMGTSPINTSWDFQDSNARASFLGISGTRKTEDPVTAPSKPSPPARTESFKNKLKEELARTISATLQEIQPYSHRNDDSINHSININNSNNNDNTNNINSNNNNNENQGKPPVSYTSANTSRIPSMDDALREIRISTEDMDTDIVTTTIQLYNVTYSPELPTYTHSREGHSACTYMHSSLDKTAPSNCGPPVPSVFDIKPNTEGRENPLSTETKYTTLLPPELNACVKATRPPPKSYVRPIIFNKMLTGNTPSDSKAYDDEQSLDSGLYNTNSTDDSHMMHTDLSLLSKGTRESFEQHEISLGIVDEFGRLRRNSDLVKDRSSDAASAIASDKERSERELDNSLSRIEIPERERTFVKSENTTIEEHKEDDEDEDEDEDEAMDIDEDAVSVAGTYVMSRSENVDAVPSSCDEEGLVVDDDLIRNTTSPSSPLRNTGKKEHEQQNQQQQQQSPSKNSICNLSPDINRYDSTAPGIPHGSFSYEEEIIETYNYVGQQQHQQQHQQQQQQQTVDTSAATSTFQDNINVCYKSNTNYYPIEMAPNKPEKIDEDEKEENIDELFKDRDLDDVINSIRLALGAGPERRDLSRDFDDDSISKTRSNDCTEEMISPITLETSKHNKNCL